ncbi:MAG: hypothetical protein Q4D82_04620 [Neisseria sp.]|nr:hypothetical protein [Neisseria sp.]
MSSQNINISRPIKGKSPIVGIRIPRDEMNEIRQAAIFQDVTYSDFIRTAALRSARRVNNKAAAQAQS